MNEKLFDELRKLELPSDQYVIVASGPMGIRGLREMSDVDILVTDEFWDTLAVDYEAFYEHEALKLKISDKIEALCEASFGPRNPESPSSYEQIKDQEIIDDLPFQNLKTTLFFKRLGKRDKDKNDVKLIENWLNNNK